jgi:hypothetical protein
MLLKHGGDPVIIQSFGSRKTLQATLKDIFQRDSQFHRLAYSYFRPCTTAQATAQHFNRIHLDNYRGRNGTGRPSLPAMADYYAAMTGIKPDMPEYTAMLTVALRAEKTAATEPAYHNRLHFADVTAATTGLIATNDAMWRNDDNGAIDLTPAMKGRLLTAALGHDLDHPGISNPKTDMYANERRSFEIMRPLLENAGLSVSAIGNVETMLLGTSPDGPSQFVKCVEALHQQDHAIDWHELDPDGRYQALRGLANRTVSACTAWLRDADVYASTGAGLSANQYMCARLSEETGQDLNNAECRQRFLEDYMGGCFASAAAHRMAGPMLEKLRHDTQRQLACAPLQNRPAS